MYIKRNAPPEYKFRGGGNSMREFYFTAVNFSRIIMYRITMRIYVILKLSPYGGDRLTRQKPRVYMVYMVLYFTTPLEM